MPPQRSRITPEQLLADYPPPVRQLAAQLRQLVKTLVPAVAEGAYPVWRGIGYRHPEAGYFAAIFLHSDRVKLGLEQGARLLYLTVYWAAIAGGIDPVSAAAVNDLTRAIIAVGFVDLPLFALTARPVYSLWSSFRRRGRRRHKEE